MALGRGDLVRQLRELLVPKPSGGRTVVVTGVPGVGKTTVVTSCLDELSGAGVRVVAAAADELTSRQPFASVRALVDPDPQPDAAHGDETRAQDPVSTALARVDAWCSRGPVVVFADDAHHLDSGSLDVLSRLSWTTRALPLSLVLTTRSRPQRPELAAFLESAGSTQLVVTPLDHQAVVEVVVRRTGAVPGPVLLGKLEVASGNPFALSLLLDSLERRGALHRSGTEVEVHTDDEAVPPSLAAMIHARLSQLPPDTVDLATTFAVLGTPADPVDVAAMTHQSVTGVYRLLAPAVDAGVLRWQGEHLVFGHDLYRETLLEDLPEPLRRAVHRQAVAVLQARAAPAAQVAEHVLRSGDVMTSGVVRSAATDLQASAPGVAADLLAGLQGLVPADETDLVVADRAQALFLAGRGREAEDLVRTYLPRTSSPVARVRMQRAALRSLVDRANIGAAVAETENLIASPETPDRERVELGGLRCWLLVLDGQLARAEDAVTRLVAAAPDDASRRATEQGLDLVRAGVDLVHGRAADAAARTEQMARAAAEDPELAKLAAPAFPALFLLYAEGPDRARAANAAARAVSSARAVRWVEPFHDFVSGDIAFEAGQWDDALAALDSGLEIAQETGSGWVAVPHGLRALIDAHRGALPAARQRLDRLARTRLPPQFGLDFPGLARLAIAEAEAVAAAVGAPEGLDAAGAAGAAGTAVAADAAGAPVAAQAAQLWRAAVARGGTLWPVLIAADVARAGGPRLRDEVAEHIAGLRLDQLPRHAPVRAQLDGMTRRDLAAVVSSAQQFAAAGNPRAAACAWEEAALLAAPRADTSGASSALRHAVEVYDDLGATTDATRARARGRAAGVRHGGAGRRNRSRSGWEALTPTERTVVSLVRRGLTNPQIAGELFLSPRTVQTHVSHVLQKTALRSRVEIATAAVG